MLMKCCLIYWIGSILGKGMSDILRLALVTGQMQMKFIND